MSREIVVKRTQAVFREIFDDEQLVINDSMSASNLANWDSLNHINLIGAIQREFNIKFELNEVQHLTNVGRFIDLIIKKINP